jgi:DNA processing protein
VREKISEEDLFYAIALTFVNRIGSITARKLIAHFGQPKHIFRETRKGLIKLGGVSSVVAASIFEKKNFLQAEKEIAFAEKYGIDILYIHDEAYPYRLRHCPDAPIILYKKGNASLNPLKSLSVVGTRQSTTYGRDQTEALIRKMQGDQLQIISGLAFGIDSIAHKAALDSHLETISVLGTGLNMIYPAQNRPLAKKICEQGALITEFSSQLTPEKENFPRRNRIIAGMSDAVIVVEAGKRGGALITAELANSYSRDVFAVPGKIGDTYSEGCNWLVKTNKAALVTSADDIYYNMNWELPGEKKQGKQISIILTEEEEKIARILIETGECSVDFICNSTGFTLSKTAGLLLNMEMSGVIRSLPGKMYRLA